MIVKIKRIAKFNLEIHTYIDVGRIIAIEDINSPSSKALNNSSKYHTFRIYFDNFEWSIDSSCYKKLLEAWLLVKNKSSKDTDLIALV